MSKKKLSIDQILEENGYSFTTFKGGEVDSDANQEEPLLPTGVEQEDEEEIVESKRPVQEENEMLFPTGLRIGNGDELLERQRPIKEED